MISFVESNKDYHANAADGSGDIRRMLISPALYFDAKNGIRGEVTAALLFGIASHLALLEPEVFAARCAIKPDGMSFVTKEGKKWREDHAGHHIVPAADAVHLHRMHARMPDEVRAIFAACTKEVTVRTQINGVAVQARPDLWDMRDGRFYDLKSTLDAGDIERAIYSHRYDVQLQFYKRVLQAETGRKASPALIFVEKRSPYRWRIIELDPDYQAIADEAIDEALAQIAARRKSGCWDDPAPLRDIVSPPSWLQDSIPIDHDLEPEEV